MYRDTSSVDCAMHTSLFVLPLVVLFLRPGPAVRLVLCIGVVHFGLPNNFLIAILYYLREQFDTCNHFPQYCIFIEHLTELPRLYFDH